MASNEVLLQQIRQALNTKKKKKHKHVLIKTDEKVFHNDPFKKDPNAIKVIKPTKRDFQSTLVETSDKVFTSDESLNLDGDGNPLKAEAIVYPITQKEKALVAAKLYEDPNGPYSHQRVKYVTFPTPNLFLFIGESWAGKTHALIYLLKYFWVAGRFRFGIVFAPTKFNSVFNSFIKRKDAVIEGYTDTALANWLNYLKGLRAEEVERLMREEGYSYEDADDKAECPPSFIVFDDIVGVLQAQSKTWLGFISTVRHYNVTCFITAQDLMLVSPLVRKQARNVFLWPIETKRERDAVYEHYGQLSYPRREEFEKMLSDYTSMPYAAMLVRREVNARFIQERYTIFIAPPNHDKAIKKIVKGTVKIPIKIDF